ncbi:MAG: histidine kinase [Chryseolinea sp.]
MSYRLSRKQKWQLALTLLILYYPVLLYIDVPVYEVNGKIPIAMIWHESLSISVVCVIFFLWVSVSEWILNLLFIRVGEEFLLELKWRSQLLVFFMAIVLSFAFVVASREALWLVESVVQSVFNLNLLMTFPDSHNLEFWNLYKRTNIGFILIIMLSAFYLIANRRANLRMKEVQLKTERLEKENTLAQLHALRNQVNPHFLFNSLSILSSLVHEKSELSGGFINELSKFYRYTLDQSKENTVTLRTEMNFVKSYLYLLDLRFNTKLKIITSIHDDALDHYGVAPLTLQLLIENAVKHNQMSLEAPLTIRIFIKDGYIMIRNNLQSRDDNPETTQIGLRNILDRYKILTERPVVIDESNGEFCVGIPLLT